MSRPVTLTDPSKVERLLRSLVGVSDLHLVWRPDRSLASAHILRDTATQQHQLVRNVVSGLHAGFGIRLDTAQVLIYDDAAVFAAIPRHPAAPAVAEAARDVVRAPATSASPAPAPVEPTRAVNVRPPVPRRAAQPVRVETPVTTADDPAITLESINVERHAGALRCRVVLAQGERKYAAIAEVLDAPAAEAELAARVTLDALRAGSFTTGLLEGVGFMTISDTNYVTVAVRVHVNEPPRVGGAPLIDSMAWSAAAAVLRAAGPLGEVDSPVPAGLPARAR